MLILIPTVNKALEAQNIADKCQFVVEGKKKNAISNTLDNNYKTTLLGVRKDGIICSLPLGEKASGVYIKFSNKGVPWCIQEKRNNKWETIAKSNGEYLADFIEIQGLSTFKICPQKNLSMNIIELEIFGQGDIPKYVQRWQLPLEKCDLLLVHAHPDDEHVFLGGILPYYSGQKKIQCLCLVPTMYYRKLEYLDGLWHCGIKNYPRYCNFGDVFSQSLKGMWESWTKSSTYGRVGKAINLSKPDIIVTHDINGEYGHGAHQACADAVINYVKNPDSKNWQVKKLYVHMYGENKIHMNWRVRLEKFGGKTAFDMSVEAFKMHRSQQKTEYMVSDEGQYSISDYGLYYTTVGEDKLKNDMFENIKN